MLVHVPLTNQLCVSPHYDLLLLPLAVAAHSCCGCTVWRAGSSASSACGDRRWHWWQQVGTVVLVPIKRVGGMSRRRTRACRAAVPGGFWLGVCRGAGWDLSCFMRYADEGLCYDDVSQACQHHHDPPNIQTTAAAAAAVMLLLSCQVLVMMTCLRPVSTSWLWCGLRDLLNRCTTHSSWHTRWDLNQPQLASLRARVLGRQLQYSCSTSWDWAQCQQDASALMLIMMFLGCVACDRCLTHVAAARLRQVVLC